MKRIHRIPYLRITLLVAALGAAGLYAAVTFNPATQPYLTVSPYTLQNTNLAEGDTRAYRTWYENGAWQGDLIEYDIASTGARYTDVAVGYSPPGVPVDGDTDGHINWSVRAVFAAAEGQTADGTTSNPQQYDGVPTITDYWMETADGGGRNIFTVSIGSQVPFLWNNLSTTQRAALDSGVATTGAYDSDILNFIRGDRSNEFPDGTLRRRYSLMGDIIRSQPVYVAKPVANFTLPYYAAYKTAQASRAGRVFVGSNDGMVHAFDTSDGSEAYAYIPSMLMPELPALAARPYTHKYYVDSELYAGDACPGTCSSSSAWKTFLTGGLGAGGKGLWALNITNADYDTSKVVWERLGDEASPPTGYTPSHMGHIYNRPQIALMPNGKWYVVTGNGYGSTSGDVVLYLFPLNGGDEVITHVVGADTGNGLSGITLVDTDGDFRVETGYAGDIKGNLYKFTFGGSDGDSSPTVTNATLINVGVDRPITVSPDVGRHPNGGYFIYFGTGSLLSSADATNTATQRIYAIWDSKPGGSYPISDSCDTDGTVAIEGPLVCQTLGETTFSGTAVRYVTQATPNWSNHYGWRVELPDSGERLLGNPQLRAERLQFITTNTAVDGVDSWLMGLDWLSGSDGDYPKEVMYDLNQDGLLNDSDKVAVDLNGNGVTTDPEDGLFAPVALNLGDGNLSQPTIARIGGGVDIHYINGLRLPAPESNFGPILGGLIDVTTDTPYGGITTLAYDKLVDDGLQEVCDSYSMTTCRGSPGQPVSGHAGEGYAGVPDGHVHGYDKVHGTPYVDYLTLEPRRGLPRLDAYTGDDATVDDTLARLDRLGAASGSEEPYASGTHTSVIDPDQKFVVVLSNADLSTGPALQIGCRTWNVTEYQDMLRYQLETQNRTPAALQDTYHGNKTLVFTLNSIREDHDDGLPAGQCAPETIANGIEKSETATMRVLFYNRVVEDLAILPTLPQCVWGIHKYDVRFDYSTSGYIDPAVNAFGHLTPAQEKSYTGYRWRNGALTLQMLAVNSDNTAGYVLQPATGTITTGYDKKGNPITETFTYLPKDKNGARVGGIIAKAVRYDGINSKFVNDMATSQSGLLYESSVFFDFGDWFNFKTGSASLYCYGASTFHSRLVQEVVQGLDWGHYTQLTDIFFTDGVLNSLYYQYLDLVNAVQAATTEEEQRDALQNLADFFADNPDVGAYDKLRSWRGHKVWHQENTGNEGRILPIDRSDYTGGGGTASDGTPEQVDDISRNLTPVLGPNFITGRRTWIDLRP
ncbi:pilus assembly protein [Thioalbus denitrificans]|uniref:PilC-like protein with beta-propeller domain n=1 Tax=Thioalbus denitrificans TaxID=547122 RepID=A0A369C793_9GAMM|nr:PilC/PilY family type IV pilus protein [Thioalbus denitrificans]RCX29880.1 PilC-like protein with beta-propeller domain [Thioalbus denitrificans]